MFDPALYPGNWKAIVKEIRSRSLGRCECAGECGAHSGACSARNYELHPITGSLVILTTAHLWRGPCRDHHARAFRCGELDHLKHLCQFCHLNYDRPLHIAKAKRRRFEQKAVADLFETLGWNVSRLTAHPRAE
jgi:hypothetical protein